MAKNPTPSAISALLRKAGFERAVISVHGGTSGYQVTKGRARPEVVKVRHYASLGNMPDQHYRQMITRYAAAIEKAGYATERGTYHLVVAARPDHKPNLED